LRDDEGAFVLAKTTWLSSVCTIDLGEGLPLYLRFDNVDFVLGSNSGGRLQ